MISPFNAHMKNIFIPSRISCLHEPMPTLQSSGITISSRALLLDFSFFCQEGAQGRIMERVSSLRCLNFANRSTCVPEIPRQQQCRSTKERKAKTKVVCRCCKDACRCNKFFAIHFSNENQGFDFCADSAQKVFCRPRAIIFGLFRMN